MRRQSLSAVLLVVGLWLAPGAALAGTAATAPADNVLKQEITDGAASYAARNFEAAIAHYEKAVALSGKLPPKIRIVILSNLGAACREGKNLPKAKEAFKEAIAIAERAHLERDPAASTAMRQYAFLLRKLNQNVDADLMEARASGLPSGAGGSPTGAGIGQSGSGATGVAGGEPVDNMPDVNVVTAQGDSKNAKKMTVEDWKALVDQHPEEIKLRRLLAYKYIGMKNFSSAINVYLDIKKSFPAGFDEICGELAECYAKNDQLAMAAETLNRGIDSKPTNPQLYLELAAVYMSMGNVKGNIDALQSFVDKFPDDRNYSAVADRLKSLKQEGAENATPRLPNEPTRQERIYNWPDSYFPLKVYVAPNDDVHLSDSSSGISARTAGEIIQLACSEWSQATNGKLRFTFVLQPQESNIEVAFTSDPTNMESQSAAGTTQWSGRGEAPKVRVYLLGSNDGKSPLEPERLLETTLHEFGHAVGLEHSNNVKDVMYYQMRPTPVTQPSEVDARRVIVLYTR